MKSLAERALPLSFAVIMALGILLPLLMMFTISVNPNEQDIVVSIGTWRSFIPQVFSLENYIEVWTDPVHPFPRYFANPAMRRRNAFCYIDARDLGQIVDRCLAVDGLGFQVFNAGNDTNGMNIPTAELIARYFPGVPVTRALGEHEALFANRKIREVLGFREAHDWRRYVPG